MSLFCHSEVRRRISRSEILRFAQDDNGLKFNREWYDSLSPIRFKDKNAEHFFGKTVVTSSKGIPIVAVQMCQKARGTKQVSLTFVREEIMPAHKASVKYIDLTPLILIAIGLIGALRYIGRGMGNQELYIIAGTLTAAAIVIRVLMPRRSRQRKA